MSRRGFSLLELMVAVGLFTVVSALIFSFFRFGTRSFAQANAKHLLQTDALRVIESLQTELRRTSLATVLPLNMGPGDHREMTIDGEIVHRDVVSFSGIKNWKDKTSGENFDLETTAPLWNRYFVYYATRDIAGKLIRLKIDPDIPPQAPLPMLSTDFDNCQEDDPKANRFKNEGTPYIALSHNVYDFSVERQRGSFDVSLKLREKHQVGPNEPGPRRPFDYYELKLTVKSENSFPNDL